LAFTGFRLMKSFTFLSGGGAMGQMLRDRDWSATPLGEPADWPASLKTAVAILLSSGYPMYIAWGPGFTQIYNDAYRPILGSTKHPAALGISTVETFREIWDFIGPMFRDVMDTGRASTYVDQLLLLERHGFREECYFTFSYSAIPSEDGIGGVLVTCLETTDRVIQERRLRVLRDLLEARTRDNLHAIAQASAEALAHDRDDLPFALFFEVAADGSHALCCHQGLQGDALASVEQQLRGHLAGATPGLASLVELAPAVDTGAAGADPVQRVACIGVAAPGRNAPQLVLVAGLSPRLDYSQRYDEFLRGVTANIGSVIAEVEALEHERRRAQELAEIDRAKTVFFSDVSHEFRTPIALMLGPIEEAIEATTGEVRDNLLIARRNTARLLKLVNSLLDFSRIEAGRMQANFESVDLAQFTSELASNFRSATDRAGLALVVDAPPLPHAVSIDVAMWEKIVLNLLSNAFKHTFEGAIRVRLHEQQGRIVLEVGDTGIGIPEAEVAHVFERFRRVPNARSRTHEGSGIGLALVRELVRMHGGEVSVRSREGEGSVFTVALPADARKAQLAASPGQARPQATAAYVEEALRWLPDDRLQEAAAASEPAAVSAEAAKILIADDNADMREYLRRLVSQRWNVRTALDGEEALAQARSWQPELVLSDVMMPRLDGFELIARLRADEATAAIPVVLLSARAGEDARLDGLRAGADDYLVKPFSARDLVARIEAQLARSHSRRDEQAARLRLSRLFEQAPVGIALLHCPEFTYTIANRPYRELVGREELLGKTVRQALPELEGQGIYELLEQVRATQEPYVGESTHLRLMRRGVQDEGWFTFVFQPIVDPGGHAEAILVIVYEVTELARAKQAAEVANVAKDEFLAMLGHELRNPLAPIVTALQIMSLRDGAEPTRERQIIERQVKHLMRLVDDLLDVSRVTQGKLELKREAIEIAQVVGDAVEQVKPLFERRKQVVEVTVAGGLRVDGDPKRLAQVVSNLLTNASKFSGEGACVRVAAGREGQEVVLRVIDQGVGLAANQLARVFDVFYQGRQTFDRSEGGLGLGLAIVRNIVDLHGGTVRADSAGPGQGSEFVVRLPLLDHAAAAPAHSPAAIATPPVPGKRILVVDDNRDAADTLAELLKLGGHAARVAFDAQTALAVAAEFRPQAAFLDLGLPGMSGYELAQALWALPQLETLPVFAVSGYGQAEDRKRSAHQGFTGHLVKPVSSEQLAATLHHLFSP
jgi:PAS domain S-box-containing protein